jgi:hypothetical protein
MERDAHLEVHRHLAAWAESHAPAPAPALALFLGTVRPVGVPVPAAPVAHVAAHTAVAAKVALAATLVAMTGAAAVGVTQLAGLAGDPAPPPAVDVPFGGGSSADVSSVVARPASTASHRTPVTPTTTRAIATGAVGTPNQHPTIASSAAVPRTSVRAAQPSASRASETTRAPSTSASRTPDAQPSRHDEDGNPTGAATSAVPTAATGGGAPSPEPSSTRRPHSGGRSPAAPGGRSAD